ncbi:MAG: hypothetical protein K6L73_02540 [Cellvibrionaceae bacterium]
MKYRGPLIGFLMGTVYALICAGVFTFAERHSLQTLEFVSIAMIVGTPITVGVITVLYGSVEQAGSRFYRLLYPWLSVFGWSVISLVFAWETIICVVMLLPIYLPLASFGGAIGGYVRVNCCKKTERGVVSCFSVLPLVLGLAEIPINEPTLHNTVVTTVFIDAPIDKVWKSLPSVKDIRKEELPWTLSHFLGIPRPVSAITEELKEGGVRDIWWEKGVHFQERITEIVEPELLAYEVLADQESMEVAELDTHIVVGDQYFEVESGQYSLIKLDSGTQLTLRSSYRMTTNLNWYGKFWADWVLDDFHYSVLTLLRTRNEKHAN